MEVTETTDVKAQPDLDSPALYANRELSWLDFNDRVLQLAEDESTPLMERAKFLAIYTSNLDEFEMVRVQMVRVNTPARPTLSASSKGLRAVRPHQREEIAAT